MYSIKIHGEKKEESRKYREAMMKESVVRLRMLSDWPGMKNSSRLRWHRMHVCVRESTVCFGVDGDCEGDKARSRTHSVLLLAIRPELRKVRPLKRRGENPLYIDLAVRPGFWRLDR